MFHTLKNNTLLWLGIGFVGGLIVGGVWPDTPMHASATDSYDKFAIATGSIDGQTEGIFVLDQLTGQLSMTFVNQLGKLQRMAPRDAPRGGAAVDQNAFRYPVATRNIAQDMQIDFDKNPRFLLVTGLIRRSQRAGPQGYSSQSVAYVAELTSGKLAAYGFAWDGMASVSAGVRGAAIVPLDWVWLRTDK